MSTHQTPGRVHLSVTVPSGSVRIDARDVSETEIQVEPRNSEARELMDEVRERVQETPDGGYDVMLEVPGRGKKWGFFGSEPQFYVSIVVPAGSDMRVETVSADVRSSGRMGSARVHSTSGDISIEQAAGAEIRSVSGDIDITTAAGDVSAQAVSGDVEIGDVEGSLTVKTVSGDVSTRKIARDARATTVSGDLQLGTVMRGEVTVKSTSGDIDIGVMSGADVWMDVSSLSGTTRSELDSGDEAPEKLALEIRASSLSGDVTIRRAAAVNA